MAKRAALLLTYPADAIDAWYSEPALAELHAIADVRLNRRGRILATAELIEDAAGAEIIICDLNTPAEAAVFRSLPDLIACIRAVVDIRTIDIAAASAAGVLVTQASRGFMAAVAEWVIGAMVNAARHFVDYAAAYRAGSPPAARMGGELRGSTLGIIGYGAIAARLARLALAFEMKVLVTDPYKKIAAPLVQTDLDTLLADADFVVPLAPATPETENLIGRAALARMKPTAWLINASRGNLVDEAALAAALDARRIAGAVLDVGRNPSELPSPALAARHDVIATPHIAGLSRPSILHQSLETARQAAAVLRGEAPVGSVNAASATRLARRRS